MKTKDRFGEKIKDVHVANSAWPNSHWQTIKQFYGKAQYFTEVASFLEPLYREATNEIKLSRINQRFISSICNYMEIETKISTSMDYNLPDEGTATERLIKLLKSAKGEIYFSGPTAKAYLDPSKLEFSGIELKWMDYSSYPEYPQFYGKFEHAVSIIDLLFHTGKDAKRYLRRI